MKLNFREFTTLSTNLVTPISPKGQSETALEFVLDIDGEQFNIRTFAPNNYRQVWIKMPKRYYDSWKERLLKGGHENWVHGDWIRTASHDSGWYEGFDLKEYTNWNEKLISFKRLVLLKVTPEDQDWFEKEDFLKDDMPIVKGIALSPVTYMESLIEILDWIQEDDKKLVARFTNEANHNSKDVEVFIVNGQFKQAFPLLPDGVKLDLRNQLISYLEKYFKTKIENIRLYDLNIN